MSAQNGSESALLLTLAKPRDARIASASELAATFASAQSDALVALAGALAREQPWSEPVT